MSDRNESVWVVFNGEIYNFRELRTELQGHGHVFRTSSDTEVLVHGYKQWGDSVLDHLNGMFGLAIWDVQRQRLLIARDPFGIKMLYYRVENGRLWFGSEVRAVLATSSEPVEADLVAMNLFLRYRYTPSPYTLFRSVKKLAPGTMLICENGACQVKRWYQVKPAPMSPPLSDSEAIEELTALYKQAMQRHLNSDVPVGLLLSGGVDSGLLLALMNRYGSKWQTFTVGYGSQFADDELDDAAETARYFGSRHTPVLITRSFFEQALPRIVASLEEPIAASSIVPMYFVCERARQEVKVALVGQGPDELFGGYRRHLGVRYGGLWRELPNAMRIPLTSLLGMLPRNETLKRGLYSLDIPQRLRRYQHVLSIMPEQTIDNLFHDGQVPSHTGDKILESWEDLEGLMENTDELGGLQFLELRSTLPDELLMYADKLSMAHGLELRIPYLDKQVVEFMERLPSRFKVRGRWQKWLHRQVCKAHLPTAFLNRRKRGFAVNVVDDWFRDHKQGKIADILHDRSSHMYRYLRYEPVQELYKEHHSGRNDNHKILFSLVVLEEWLRSHSVACA